MIASVAGRVAAKHGDRVVIQTAGGVGYELIIPLGVMERLPAAGEPVTLVTELIVREDGSFLYGFLEEGDRRFFQRLIGVAGVGPRIAIALLSARSRCARVSAASRCCWLTQTPTPRPRSRLGWKATAWSST